MDNRCFHCGEPLPANPPQAQLGDTEKPVCCIGCKAVAELIHQNGLDNFYQLRKGETLKPADYLATATAEEWLVFDQASVQQELVETVDENTCETSLLIEGVHCAACTWLIRQSLGKLEGVDEVEVNPATTRATLRWDPKKTRLSQLLHTIARLGYRPHPGKRSEGEQVRLKEKRQAILRLGLAGMGMMQVMTYAISLYTGIFEGMDEGTRTFLRYVSMLITTPVLFYSGLPFLKGAWRDIKNRHLGMDVPVALALLLAYLASVWETLNHGPHVYFDSVVMFVFFLLVARQVEQNVRHKAGSTADALSELTPASAIRLTASGQETVAIQDLKPDDRVLVRDGEAIPADGIIVSGGTFVDESLITGESRPVWRSEGQAVIAGSTVQGDPVEIRITRTGRDTVLSTITRLLERAQSQSPPIARLTDRIAAWFVGSILLLAAGTAGWWAIHDPANAFSITISVLVVTCPCALSLATPVSLAAASAHMTARGLLVAHSSALETLPEIDTFVFDKTGTLTTGQLEIQQILPEPGLQSEQLLELAAMLEQSSAHPIAKAFAPWLKTPAPIQVRTLPGQGVEAHWQGHDYRLGQVRFALDQPQAAWPENLQEGTRLCLSRDGQAMGWFVLRDTLREDAASVIQSLQRQGLRIGLLSGDEQAHVQRLANTLRVDFWQAEQMPEDKLERIQSLQRQGHRVAMVGDGVNDAPVLAAADVSVAMGQGAALAQTTSDLILLAESLRPLDDGHAIAQATRQVIRQNLSWAVGYNLLAIPLAAAGWVEPWMAALGMSASSLVVVLNAWRITRVRTRNH